MTDSDPLTHTPADDAFQSAERYQSTGDTQSAERFCQRALELEPEHGGALCLLAEILKLRGDLPGAISNLELAVHIEPGAANAWLELARARHDLQDWKGCIEAAVEILKRDPANIEANLMRAISFFGLQEFEQATEAIQPVVLNLPDDGGIHLFHARCLLAQNAFTEAFLPAQRAAALLPNSQDANYVHGACLKRLGKSEEAETALRRCLELNPEHIEAWNDLGDILFARGDTQAALRCLRTSLAAAPFNLNAISGLCFYSAFDPNTDAAALFKINRAWSRQLVDEADNDSLPTPSVARADKRIRIGYLAYDLYDHVTSWFLEPILSHHDRNQFHITGYYGPEQPDQVTAHLGEFADSWQDIRKDSVAETAARVRQDDIDILVLSSFYRGKDRRVLAFRAAPVQVGGFNRVASTGLDTTDYIITEAESDPTGDVEQNYTEALVRLTSHSTYLPPSNAPRPLPPPCLKNGFVTFGSFNNLAKISDETVATWADLLKSVADSRLILRSSTHFDNPTTQKFFLDRFAAHGITADQLIFQGLRPTRHDHLAGIREADIALDPFPCNGGTTSCESLWMGLPLVTLETDSFMGRQGTCLLTKLGLGDLIAKSATDYTDIARQLAANFDRLIAMRDTLRPNVEKQLFDYDRHILELETSYKYMLECRRNGRPPAPFSVSYDKITKIS